MKYYVMANENYYTFDFEYEAEDFAISLLNDDRVTYLEYGVIRYDD